MFFFFWRSFRAYFYFVLTPGDTGTFSPLSSGLCSCGTYSAFAPLGLFNIPLMKNFSVKKEYLPELDLFPIQHFAYNRQHYKNLTKEFFQKSIFSCSNIAKIPVFWKLWDICEKKIIFRSFFIPLKKLLKFPSKREEIPIFSLPFYIKSKNFYKHNLFNYCQCGKKTQQKS